VPSGPDARARFRAGRFFIAIALVLAAASAVTGVAILL